MKTRTKAILGSVLLLTGALFLTSCDDTQLPQTPGVEEEDGAEDQDEGNDQENGQNEEQNED
ncbi:hypothetical protein [Arthrobacter roseus]|uniref:hypothetical protein n=1 Tax=Arthrobacter roseus TaxID=136274 RepID=UPI0019652B86|nr:hypothetical protein [Arthrobacter roseus]MBM7849646.1 hypothetical protein [Arthrobacter roseus]